MYDVIFQQLADHCDCIDDFDSSSMESNIEQLIMFVSELTCWRNETCGTFLSSDRYERFPIDFVHDCNCNHKIMTSYLRYLMVKEETIVVNLVTIDGVKRIRTQIDAEDIGYDSYENRLDIDLYKYITECGCGCDKPAYLEVYYVAGYDCIPHCLLPIFCDYLQYVIDLNKCRCQKCSNCGEQDDITINESNELQEQAGAWTKTYILNAYNRQLGYISLCRETRLRGVVV